MESPTDALASAHSTPEQHVTGDGTTAIAVSVAYALILAAGGGYVFYASIRPVSIPTGFGGPLADFPWAGAYLLLAADWLLGPVLLLILGLAQLRHSARLNWWTAAAWVGTLAAGAAIGVVVMHDFHLLFTSYPRDLDGTPLGPSRFAPAAPYWRDLIAAGGQLAVSAVMFAFITALTASRPTSSDR